jgi:GH24 family phage-related lysozyme (muramidase)
MTYKDQYRAALTANNFEGRTKFFILDIAGLVTIAVGIMVPDIASALKLPLRVQSTGDLAGESAVAADFRRVAAMQKGHLPGFYYEYESLVLADEDIDELLSQRIDGFDEQLTYAFPWYVALPDPAKMALLDMAFNLGVGRAANGADKATGVHVYGKMLAALSQTPPDFVTAANDCGRCITLQSFALRNKWTRAQFLAAQS